jgi:hypothetical protein
MSEANKNAFLNRVTDENDKLSVSQPMTGGILQSLEMSYQGTKAEIKKEFIDPYGISEEKGILAVHLGIVNNSLLEDYNFLRNKEPLDPIKAEIILDYMIDTFNSRIDFLYSGFSYLEPTCPEWIKYLCQMLPSQFNVLIDRMKQYTRQQFISDITKDHLIARLDESKTYSDCLLLDNFGSVALRLSINQLQELSASRTYALCRPHGKYGGFGKYLTSSVKIRDGNSTSSSETNSTEIYYRSLTAVNEAYFAVLDDID